MSILKRIFLNICFFFKQTLPRQSCILCGAHCHHNMCCNSCKAAFSYLDQNRCPVCALPTLNSAVCGHCLLNPPAFAHTVAVFSYTFPMDKLILAYKYGEKLRFSGLFAEHLAMQVMRHPDYLVAMPLHPLRLQERGFNQSLLLARQLGRRFNLPVLALACQRIRNTPSQSALPLKARKKNMRNAFICSVDFTNKHVAIVDDVMTTGTTMNELALTLLNAGAAEVSAWVVARALPHYNK